MSQLDELLLQSTSYKNKDGSYNKLRHPKSEVYGVTNDTNTELINMPTLDEILTVASQAEASDIHIVVGGPPKYRIDGELIAIPNMPILNPVQVRQLLEPSLDDETAEMFDKEGDLDFAYTVKNVGRFRANYYKQRGTWAGVFRKLSNKIPSSNELGLPNSVVKLNALKRGLVLVTGPTGSGKSTTLASLIDQINATSHRNIITLEDPIEYLHKHKQSNVSQREMGVDSKNFASALRAALREDPDVILVGEMRDYETISTAVTAAETGHLVFSTLHTIGAAATIDRILDTYPPQQQAQARSQLSVCFQGIISQQLVPQQYGGRVAAFEVMLGTDPIRSLIREGKTEQLATYIQNGRQDGMMLMDDYLVQLLTEHKITPESALQFAVDKKRMKERLHI